tara:strand:- start:45 stop:245 length:201 start_codon:yes stop_codon:yes gene_type:complete
MSRTITGLVLLIFGIVMLGFGVFIYVTLPYGIVAVILGLFILFNNKEDHIEPIKGKRKNKHKGGNK